MALTLADIQRAAQHMREKAIPQGDMMAPNMAPAICIGIDPGTETGYAEWGLFTQALHVVKAMSMYEAQKWVLARRAEGRDILVVIEDARKSTTGRFGRHFGKTSVLQGVGSVKRESKLWVEFLTAERIPLHAIKPRRRATKKDAALFARITGWPRRTNEHGRDAAMFVYGMGHTQARQLIENWRNRK